MCIHGQIEANSNSRGGVSSRLAFLQKGPRPTALVATLLSALLTVVLLSSPCVSQESTNTGASTPAEADIAGQGASDSPAMVADLVTEDPIEATAPQLMEQVDGIFSYAVEQMEAVLFYRIGKSEQAFIQVDDQHWYVRNAGTDGRFDRLVGAGRDDGEQLSSADVARLEVLGKLLPNAAGQSVRRGTLGGRPIEFVVVQNALDKYVRRGDTYRRDTGFRQLLSDDATMSAADVTQAAANGLLAPNPLAADEGEDPYVQTEFTGGIPLVVAWLALGAVIFTLYMGFVNFWAFTHAVTVVRGKYDNPTEPGEITHFQALASALSATVGLGNIAGVTIAMQTGGPGAFFWMLACGFFGMTSKFVECTLGQRYRRVKEDGTVLGGPMQYLREGLAEIGLGPLGTAMSIVFAVMCILASFGGGNMFQANQSGQQMLTMFQLEDYEQLGALDLEIKEAAAAGNTARMNELLSDRGTLEGEMDAFSKKFLPVFGVILAAMVAAVIIGGIKRIGATASKIVPTMCLIYVVACVWIILNHIGELPQLVTTIFTEAFSPRAFGGGFLGILVVGVQRAAFSNEAGVGSASIAHSAAKTEEPVREGIVALLGPFIDTIVVCSMTALVILITGAWNNQAWVVEQGLAGTPLTSKAFEQEISFFPYVLSIAVLLFAYSTIISWSYYGERCWERLFGPRSVFLYRLIYVGAVLLGAVVNLGAVLAFSDMMILSMAFPNITGLLLLSPKVRKDLANYWARLKAGEFQTYS